MNVGVNRVLLKMERDAGRASETVWRRHNAAWPASYAAGPTARTIHQRRAAGAWGNPRVALISGLAITFRLTLCGGGS